LLLDGIIQNNINLSLISLIISKPVKTKQKKNVMIPFLSFLNENESFPIDMPIGLDAAWVLAPGDAFWRDSVRDKRFCIDVSKVILV